MTYITPECDAEFSPKDPAEIVTLTFQFANVATTTLSSPVVTVSHLEGISDATPSSMVLGAATVVGTDVVQQIQGGVDGADYLVRCEVVSGFDKYVIAGVLKVRTAKGKWSQCVVVD